MRPVQSMNGFVRSRCRRVPPPELWTVPVRTVETYGQRCSKETSRQIFVAVIKGYKLADV